MDLANLEIINHFTGESPATNQINETAEFNFNLASETIDREHPT
jgi:hypothetical protein